MKDDFGNEITFGWVSSTVRHMAAARALCTTTNRSSSAPPYWPAIDEDTPDNRKELERRIRALFALTGSDLHGEHRVHLIKQWVVEHMQLPRAPLDAAHLNAQEPVR